MRIHIVLDPETSSALTRTADAEVRTPPQQAIVAIRRGLGLEFPVPKEQYRATPEAEVANAR